MVAKILSDCAEDHGLLPDQQIGARRGRSIETAFEGLVNGVYTVWGHRKKHVASLFSLDIAGAFDKINY